MSSKVAVIKATNGKDEIGTKFHILSTVTSSILLSELGAKFWTSFQLALYLLKILLYLYYVCFTSAFHIINNVFLCLRWQ